MKSRNLVLAFSIVAGAGLVLAAYAQKSGGDRSAGITRGKHETDSAKIIRARANWFYSQRAYPLKHIPAFARERAWLQYRQAQQAKQQSLEQKYGTNYQRMAAVAAQASGTVNTAASWVPIGPQPTNDYYFQPHVSGRVTAMVVDPCDSTGNTVFLGGALGGLWLTTNGGTSWTPLTDGAPSLAVGSLAVPPSTPGSAGCVGTVSKTVYVGTGEENFAIDSYYGAGVLTCTTTTGTSYSCTADQTLGKFNSTNPLSSDYAGAYIGGLAVDPRNPAILLAAVQGHQSTLPSGIWCSQDSGSSWTHVVPGPGVLGIVGTGVAFDQAGYGYAALTAGTLDGGASIGLTTANGVYKTQGAITSCSSPNFTALGALSNLSAVSGPANMGRIAISVSSTSTTSATSDEIFAAIANASDTSNTLLGVFKSTDGGSSWAQPSTQAVVTSSSGFCNNQCFYDLTIDIDPHNPNVVYAGGAAPGNGATIIASANGGSSWTDISNNSSGNTGVHVDAHAIAFAPAGSTGAATQVYVGTDGGAWSNVTPESPTASQVWNNLNGTLGLTQFYAGLSNNPSGWTFRSFGGAQDNGMQVFGQQIASSNPLAWDNTLYCGDGGVTLVDPTIPSTVYGECAYIPGSYLGGIGKSLLDGTADDSTGYSTFLEADYGINFNDDGSFIPPMAMDTKTPQNLYFGTYRVWQSTNGGNAWFPISDDVTGAISTNSAIASICSSNSGYCVLTGLAVAPTNSNEVITGSNVGEVYLSQNAQQGFGATWSDITGSGLPNRAITHVAIDPANADTLYATFSGFSGFNGDTAGHVFLGNLTSGTSPTVSWIDISGGTSCVSPAANLPNIPVNDILIDPNQPGQLFVATDVGVYVGTLEGTPPAVTGACWQPLGTGLPNSAVLSLTLNNASRTLIAGTHGRSAWALALGDQQAFDLESLSETSAAAGSSAQPVNLLGQGFTASSTVNWKVNGATPSGCTVTVNNETATTTPFTKQSATELSTSVPSACLAAGGLAQVSVTDSGSTTNSLPFTITSLAPTLTNVSPVSATAPAAATLPLTFTGSNFNASTEPGLTQINAFPSTCFTTGGLNSSGTQMTANVQASCLKYGGIFYVTATNPAPGGGDTNPGLQAYDPTTGNPICCLLQVTGPVPSNDNFSSPTAISGTSFTATEDTSGATTDGTPLPASCTTGEADNGDANSVWFKYTPSSSTSANMDTIGSAYDTILSVWTGSSASSLTNVACNDDITTGYNRVSQLSNLTLNGGTTYYIMVSTYGVPISSTTTIGDGGKLVFNMTTGAAPALLFSAQASPPNPSTVTAGTASSFTLQLTPQSGSPSGTVSIQPCTVSPSNSTVTCTYSSSSVTLNGSPATTGVQINTVARGALPPAAPFEAPPLGWLVAFLGVVSLLVFFLRHRVVGRGRAAVRSGIAAALGFALLAGVLLFSGACGGGSSSSSSAGTPAGTYTITVPTSPTATNGNQSVQLTVQ